MNINVMKVDTNVTKIFCRSSSISIYSYTKGSSTDEKSAPSMEDGYITTAVVLYSMSNKS